MCRKKAEWFPRNTVGGKEALLLGWFGLNRALTSVGRGAYFWKLHSRGLNRGPFAFLRFVVTVKLITLGTPSAAHRFALDKYCYQCIMQWAQSVKTFGNSTLTVKLMASQFSILWGDFSEGDWWWCNKTTVVACYSLFFVPVEKVEKVKKKNLYFQVSWSFYIHLFIKIWCQMPLYNEDGFPLLCVFAAHIEQSEFSEWLACPENIT